MTTIITMIRGCFGLLGRCFSRVGVLLRVTALWIILLPIVIGYAGILSNQAVLFANNDRFPVMYNDYKISKRVVQLSEVVNGEDQDAAQQANFDLIALQAQGFLDTTHVVMTSKTHLNILADIFDFKSEGIESVGDVLIDFGAWLWIFAPYMWLFEAARRLLTP